MATQEEKEPKRKIVSQLKNKYRLVIMNDDTFEEKYSLVLSPLNVFVFFGSLALFLIISVIYLIAFTSLREYIPGYADVNMRRNVVAITLKADSLEHQLKSKDLFLENLQNVLNGKETKQSISLSVKDSTKKYDKIDAKPSQEDLALRTQVEKDEKNSLRFSEKTTNTGGINAFFFFVPLNGIPTNKFKSSTNHYGIDIVAQRNEAIKSTLNGTVTLATWTSETGYVIQIQHDDNLISIYKHNSVLLKKVGDIVKAGEPIAIIGDSGELSSGPHLHFELWYKGKAIDPQEYMSF